MARPGGEPGSGCAGATVVAVAPDRESLEPEEKRVHDDSPEAQAEGEVDIDLGDENAAGSDLADETGEAAGGSDSPPVGKMESWRKRSATGAVLTGLALGFQQVFEKEREEPAIIMTTSGDPPRDLPVEAEVEHGRPRRSVVNIRPWLLDRSASQLGPEGTTATGTGTGDSTETGTATDTGTPTGTASGRDQPPAGSPTEGD